jgi:hypothetical protein
MAHEPENRYGSCRALAEDIERWMAGEPVSAWREPWPVKARRAIARHRTLVISGAVAAGMGIAGLLALLLLQQQTNQSLRASNLDLQAANAKEKRAARLAQSRYGLARKTVEAYYTGASEDVLLKKPELEALRNRLLQTALVFFREMQETLQDNPASSAADRQELAEAYHRAASITEQIGSKDDALSAFEQARAIFAALLRNRPADLDLKKQLAARIRWPDCSIPPAGRMTPFCHSTTPLRCARTCWRPGPMTRASAGRLLETFKPWAISRRNEAGGKTLSRRFAKRSHTSRKRTGFSLAKPLVKTIAPASSTTSHCSKNKPT